MFLEDIRLELLHVRTETAKSQKIITKANEGTCFNPIFIVRQIACTVGISTETPPGKKPKFCLKCTLNTTFDFALIASFSLQIKSPLYGFVYQKDDYQSPVLQRVCGLRLLYDNTSCHQAVIVHVFLKQSRLVEFPYSPYSPDSISMSPCIVSLKCI